MSVENERQQFEDAYWNGGVPIMLIGTREAIFARKDNGEYRLSHAEGAWTGWKLARQKQKAAELASDFRSKTEDRRGHANGHDELTGILAGK